MNTKPIKGATHPLLTTIKEYLLMTLGMCLYSFGWIGCVLPAKSTSGAASGLAIVISTALQNTVKIFNCINSAPNGQRNKNIFSNFS